MNREEVQFWLSSLTYTAGLFSKEPDALVILGLCKIMHIFGIFFYFY
ncbi:hypothetical protein TREVI0001_0015 [Treponema vincentii ATCC 35580]|uniref:Uncharacterized protein n=1 Tax=Treponema vincentii ATCC 35580 TaxID=596324 RepID=C8PRN3_9SPIR|nr:hypothetical protein TREVI0001_0015 [Treponema vincentii ATCC 35580]